MGVALAREFEAAFVKEYENRMQRGVSSDMALRDTTDFFTLLCRGRISQIQYKIRQREAEQPDPDPTGEDGRWTRG